jgi:hypothetical protein
MIVKSGDEYTNREEYLAKFGCRLNNEGKCFFFFFKLYKNIFLYFWLPHFWAIYSKSGDFSFFKIWLNYDYTLKISKSA